jgi:uncharacterized protein YbjT (DUF2867 family)
MPTSIFFTGATGYIGGAILDRLLTHPDRSSFAISAIIRSAEKAKRFESEFGIHPLVGSLDDSSLVTEAASKADIVIHTADADNLGAARSILAGLKKRYEQAKIAPILIHTVRNSLYHFPSPISSLQLTVGHWCYYR